MQVKPDIKTGIYYFYWTDEIAGYTKRISLRHKDKKKAEAHLARKQAEALLGLQGRNEIDYKGSIKFSELRDEFLMLKRYPATTDRNYRNTYRLFLEACGDRPINQYARKDYYIFINYCQIKNYCDKSIETYTAHLKGVFNYAIDVEYIDKSIIKIRRAQFKSEIKTIPLDELFRFLQFCKETNYKNYFYFVHTYILALRAMEALYLKWEYVDLENEEVKVYNAKRKRHDTIPMIADVKLFYSGLDIKKSGVIHSFDNYRQLKFQYLEMKRKYNLDENNKIKFNHTLRSFRATRCSQLANSGIRPRDLMKFMRHTDFAITEKYYTKTNIKDMRERINLDLSNMLSQPDFLKLINFK